MRTREELITALERAEGSEQDALICQTLRFAVIEGWITVAAWERAQRMCDAEAYESAALTLVPDDLRWRVSRVPTAGKSFASCSTGSIMDPATREWDAMHATPAIALCLAAIRARGASDA